MYVVTLLPAATNRRRVFTMHFFLVSGRLFWLSKLYNSSNTNRENFGQNDCFYPSAVRFILYGILFRTILTYSGLGTQ